ncbi:MAG TPA: 4Fe-4S dicluster domain-containing protein [Candidatus Acidoferrum sp.]|nr:4Fe-4S dicluster domain-containing protein [Candidatus Acidoferrum sp.]
MRKRFFYDMNTCIGCGSCQVACKDRHDLLPGEYFRRAGICTAETPTGKRELPFSFTCNHCEKPACTLVCPTGAMYKAEDGLVLHNDALCIGCGRCYWNCPYGEVSFSLTRGVAQKCDTCLALREQGLPPACVAACPTKSLRFGEIDEAEGEVLALPFLPEPAQTEPSTRICKPKTLEVTGHE